MNSQTAIKLPSESVRHPKSHEKYWLADQKRLFTQHGKSDLCCRFSYHGRRGFFDLETPNRAAAAKKAAERYRYVVQKGWDAAGANEAFRTQKPKKEAQAMTVGAWLAAAREVMILAPLTQEAYEGALRNVAAGAVLKLTFKGMTQADWRSKVDAVPLADITGHTVSRWMKRRLAEAEGDPLREESIKISTNSLLRCAKALFSPKKVLRKLTPETVAALPAIRPLSDVSLFGEDTSARFSPTVDPEKLLVLARDELGAPKRKNETPEAYALREQQWIATLLCFTAGLRRKEADLLTWWNLRLDDQDAPRIELATTKYLRLKNAAHAKPVPIELEVAAILRGYRARNPKAEFVLLSDRVPDLSSRIPRCVDTWNALKRWLNSKGIEKKPIHCLRKSIGSVMAQRHGIHAAQRLLRHTTPTITSRYYSDSEARETPGIGGLLAGNVRAVDFQGTQQPKNSQRKAAQ